MLLLFVAMAGGGRKQEDGKAKADNGQGEIEKYEVVWKSHVLNWLAT